MDSTPSAQHPADDPDMVVDALLDLVEVDPKVMFILNVETGQLVFLTGPVEELLGVSREALLADPACWEERLAGWERAGLASLAPELETRGHLEREFQLHRPDAGAISLRATLFQKQTGRQKLRYGVVSRVRDGGVASLPTLLRTAMESISEGLTVADQSGRFVFANPEAAAILGYANPREMLGLSWRELYPEDEVRRIETLHLPELLDRNRWRGRLRARRPDGTLLALSVSLAVMPGGEFVCTFSDVTEREAATERLARNEAAFRDFLDALSVGIMIETTDSAVRYFNRAWLGFFGLPGDADYSGPVEADPLNRRAADATTYDWQEPAPRGGRIFAVERIGCTQSPAGNIRCLIATDVTTRRQLEREAAEASRRLEELHLMQRDFISMVSHEFRTPLTSIQAVHYLLTKQAQQIIDGPGAELSRLLELQNRALTALSQLVEQVLVLNRMEHANGRRDFGLHPVLPFASEVVETLNATIGANRIQLESKLPAGYAAEFDPGQMRVALENLISNGLKYSDPPRPVVVALDRSRKNWSLQVTDQGRGIPPEDRERLFQPFSRAKNVGATPGTGLGLSIIQRIIGNHRGTIDYTSMLGVGTTFRISVPRTQPPEVGGAHPAPAVSGSAHPLPSAAQTV